MRRNSPQYTICQVLREVYRGIDDKGLRLKLRVAVSMAKSMSRKMQEHDPKYTRDFYDNNPVRIIRKDGNS